MTMHFFKLIIISLLGLLMGCGTLQSSPNTNKVIKIEKKWVRTTLEKPYYDFRRVHRMAPVFFDSLVIAGNSIDGLVAYDRQSAKEIWRRSIDGGVESGVALYNGFLYFGAGDGFFYKVNALTGEVIWTFPTRAEGLGQPTIHENSVYFIAGDNIVYSLNIENGKSLWLYNRRDPSNISVRGGSRPSVEGQRVYIGFSDGYVVALNRESGSLVWETLLNKNKRFQDIDSEPIIDGNTLYVAGYDGSLTALTKTDGAIRWKLEKGGYSAPLLSGERLYYTTTEKQIVALDKSSGKILWETPLNSLATQPTIFKGLLLSGEFIGGLKFIDIESGQILKEFRPGRGVHSKVTIDENSGDICFMSADGNIFYLNIHWGNHQRLWPWEELQ